MKIGNTAELTYPDLLWAGSEHSLQLAMGAHAAIMAGTFSAAKDEDEETPYLLSAQDGIGVIAVKGPLVNRDSWINRYVGVTSYADIRRALVYASQDASIKGILLDVESGGGAVSGVADTGNLIKTIDKKVKPVWAYADGHMASAAYWLGASARQVFSSNTAIVGSIGVICTHQEYSKAMKTAGIGVTVMRAGEFKALANSHEPLTDVAVQQIQNQLNAAYSVFIEHVADARGTTVPVADQRMGQGREFFGEQALAAGLVDGISAFDAVFSRFHAKVLDNKAVTQNNGRNYLVGTEMSRTALTETAIAALAAGVVIEGNALPGVTATTVVLPEAAPAAPVAPAAAAAAPVAAAPAAAPVAAPAVSTDVVAYLQGQLTTAQTKLAEAGVANAALQSQMESMKANFDALVAIAAKSLTNMKTALSVTGFDASKLSVETILADHAATAETFANKFKAGGVAAVSAVESAKPTIDPHLKLKVAATRFLNRTAN